MEKSCRSTRAIIHLKNLADNLACIKMQAPGKLICAAVKADAYGHGAAEISKTLLAGGVRYLAVATVDEAAHLRDAGIDAPVVLLGIADPDELTALVRLGVEAVVTDLEYIELLEAAAKKHEPKPHGVHLKIDTGMGRIGCTPEEAPELAAYIAKSRFLELAGTCTHLACADGGDSGYTKQQLDLFKTALSDIRSSGIDPGIVHAANSGAIAGHAESLFDMVRPGILLYGYYPSREQKRLMPVKPVMEFRTRISFIKKVPKGQRVSYSSTWTAPEECFIATLPLGYGDGYFRLLSSKAQVFINGQLYPVVGRVCMDQIMVNLGSSPEIVQKIHRFDEVVLFGPQPGVPTAEDLAEIIGTISYEITCAVSKRVPRIYQ